MGEGAEAAAGTQGGWLARGQAMLQLLYCTQYTMKEKKNGWGCGGCCLGMERMASLRPDPTAAVVHYIMRIIDEWVWVRRLLPGHRVPGWPEGGAYCCWCSLYTAHRRWVGEGAEAAVLARRVCLAEARPAAAIVLYILCRRRVGEGEEAAAGTRRGWLAGGRGLLQSQACPHPGLLTILHPLPAHQSQVPGMCSLLKKESRITK